MPIHYLQQDITTLEVDAIVNAANAELQMGHGVCGAIFEAAGPRDLQAACNAYGRCETGRAVITMGFNCPATYIIHAVGPIWNGGDHNERDLLKQTYMSALEVALGHDCKSVAFPLISGGIYGYPKEEALLVAREAMLAFLADHDMTLYHVVFDTSLLEKVGLTTE